VLNNSTNLPGGGGISATVRSSSNGWLALTGPGGEGQGGEEDEEQRLEREVKKAKVSQSVSQWVVVLVFGVFLHILF
jgi:hypothetical protein